MISLVRRRAHPFLSTPAETQLYTYWETFMGNVLGYPNYSTSVNGWIYAR